MFLNGLAGFVSIPQIFIGKYFTISFFAKILANTAEGVIFDLGNESGIDNIELSYNASTTKFILRYYNN